MTDAKTPKPIALGKFKPLLAGTSLARICAAALPGKYRRRDRQGGRAARGSGHPASHHHEDRRPADRGELVAYAAAGKV